MRTATTLGTDPGNNLIRIGNIASLAVNAIRGIQFELLASAVWAILHLINHGRTEVLAWVAVFGDAAVVADVKVGNSQVTGLILLVARTRVENIEGFIEGQKSVRLDSCDRGPGDFSKLLHPLMTGPCGVTRPQAPPAGHKLKRCVYSAPHKPPFKTLMIVPRLPQFVLDPACLPGPLELPQGGVREVTSLERGEDCFRRQHAALHGEVNTLQTLRIQESGRVTDDQRAIRGGRWN